MGAKYVNPIRMELTRLEKKLAIVICGYKLLKDKRDELMCQFLDPMRGNKILREKAEVGIAVVSQDLVLARPGMTDEALNVALMAPRQEVYSETETKNVIGAKIPVSKCKTRTPDPNDTYSYGFAPTSSGLDDAVKSLAGLLSDVPRLAECEKSCQLMVVEIEKTRCRANVPEHVMIPDTQPNIRYITMKLDEDEWSSQIRLTKVKDMMLEEAHHYSGREVVPMVDGM